MSADSVDRQHTRDQVYASLLQANTVDDTLALSEREKLVVELWDQLNELRLETCLLEAHMSSQSVVPGASNEEVEAQLSGAERRALEARAAYVLQNRIVEHALIAVPVRKAVHAESNANVAERRLFPLVNGRDIMSMLHTTITSDIASTTKALSTAEQSYIVANKSNQQLTESLMTLAGDTKTHRSDDVQDPQLRSQLEALNNEARAAKRKWRTIKGVVSRVVVGSGISWAQDEALTTLVLDDEDELG